MGRDFGEPLQVAFKTIEAVGLQPVKGRHDSGLEEIRHTPPPHTRVKTGICRDYPVQRVWREGKPGSLPRHGEGVLAEAKDLFLRAGLHQVAEREVEQRRRHQSCGDGHEDNYAVDVL